MSIYNNIATALRTVLRYSTSPRTNGRETNGSAGEGVAILTDNIANFEYKGLTHEVFASARNADKGHSHPRRWQFRYEPGLRPVTTSEGKVAFEVKRAGSSQVVKLPIQLHSQETDRLAYAAVKQAYPEHGDEILASNVTPLRIRVLTFQASSELKEQLPEARLNNDSWPLIGSDRQVSLVFTVPTSAKAEELIQLLLAYPFKYGISYDARVASRNAVTITFQDLRNSKLWNRLDGANTTEVFIHRNDLRELTQGIHDVVTVEGRIENPEAFDEKVYQQVLDRFASSTDWTTFDKLQWEHTYHADDLKPDVLQRTLEKAFEKDDQTKQWKRSGKLLTEAEASFLGIGSAEGKFELNLSDEGLEEYLRERNLEVEIVGERIKPKAIKLERLNLNSFKQEGTFSSLMMYVGNAVKEKPGTIDLGQFDSGQMQGGADIVGRVAALEALDSALVGTVESFLGMNIPDGWLPCDGSPLEIKDYPELYAVLGNDWGQPTPTQFNLPDLGGMFLRGVDGGAGRDPDGSRQLGSVQDDATRMPRNPFKTEEDGEHSHKYTHTPVISEQGSQANYWHLAGHPSTTDTGKAGKHTHTIAGGDPETRPKNVAVYWMIKARSVQAKTQIMSAATNTVAA